MRQRMIRGLCMLLILSGIANGAGRASGQPTEEQLPNRGGETEPISSTRKPRRRPLLPELRQQLLEREQQDQAVRKKLMDWTRANEVEMSAIDPTDEQAAPLLAEMQKVDEENRQWLKKIVQQHGWPGRTLVGRDGASAAWLLVQHADDDTDLQRDCLERMKAMPEKEVSAVDLAYLVDRVRLAEGKQQVYGTQIELKDGRWQPINVEDPDHLDRRRKEVGLPSMEAYLWSVRLFYGLAGNPTKTTPSDGAPAQPAIPPLEPYPLPSKARQALVDLAGKSDILILGELHGTQEVPAIAVALLQPLAKQGYRALALEIPSDQQGPLSEWAAGKTDRIPSFFAEPEPDGRGNVQALSLIRIALSPPYEWRLICFDVPSEIPSEGTAAEDPIADWQRRDAKMAAKLVAERSGLAPDSKVLAICGNLHARTSKPIAAQKESDNEAGDMLSKLWPSFAGRLRSDLAGRQVRSINVELHGGGYFGTTTSSDGKTSVGIQKIRGRKIDEAEAQPLDKQPWDWELNLPRATPATFLSPPKKPVDAQP